MGVLIKILNDINRLKSFFFLNSLGLIFSVESFAFIYPSLFPLIYLSVFFFFNDLFSYFSIEIFIYFYF